MSRGVALVFIVTVVAGGALAQVANNDPSSSTEFWVAFWAHPRLVFSPEEDGFYHAMKEVMFPWNDHDGPLNLEVLNEDAQWLKDHPNVRFYIDGYASSKGTLIYNLRLSQRRAEWVKQALVSRGVPENRIVLAVGWGQLYPVCPELNDECWSKNRLVRFTYSRGL
jgi:peptidoglycan-associated lipoprotein